MLAALVATPIGLLSMSMWPLARLLKVRPPRWGRRLYRQLVLAAADERALRDGAADQEQKKAEAEEQLANRPRLPDAKGAEGGTDTTPITTNAEETEKMFDFRAAAEEMLAQAQNSEPGGMMAVLAAIEALPEAMGLIAETFAVVVERCSPEEMPLDPAVNDALSDLHKTLVACVDMAADAGEQFRIQHEEDIARHTDDARPNEALWDTSNNNQD